MMLAPLKEIRKLSKNQKEKKKQQKFENSCDLPIKF